MLLALETAFEYCSISLFDKNQEIASIIKHAPRQQTQLILPMIDELMNQQHLSFDDITAIAFNRGPGSFSGIRINTAVAQALAFAHDIPCIPVSSLQAQAQKLFDEHTDIDEVTIINDAKMSEVYLANFSRNTKGFAGLQGEELLLAYQHDFTSSIRSENIFSDCLDKLDIKNTSTYQFLGVDQTKPMLTASHIASLAYQQYCQNQTVPAKDAQPVYLRNNAWKTLAEQKAAQPKNK